MRQMTVTEFKSHALQVIKDVAETREALVITKRGKPVVQVIPYRDEVSATAKPGQLSHLLAFEDDIVSPLGEEMWGSAR